MTFNQLIQGTFEQELIRVNSAGHGIIVFIPNYLNLGVDEHLEYNGRKLNSIAGNPDEKHAVINTGRDVTNRITQDQEFYVTKIRTTKVEVVTF